MTLEEYAVMLAKDNKIELHKKVVDITIEEIISRGGQMAAHPSWAQR